ncbi:MAG: iron-sulfur cluster assembly accessory protein [Proteobacteria bacterium]|nr:iron-sulfur cluster assembly accessory protein [Pseudomonadota bacterium]
MNAQASALISMTDAAAEHIRHLVGDSPEPVLGLRVAVSTKGCSGLSYTFEFADEKRPYEEEIEKDGARVFIDPMATMFLVGAQMDYEESKLRSGFIFKNPNEKSRCGCGESFSV